MTSRTSHVLRSIALAAIFAVGAVACAGSTTTLTAEPAGVATVAAEPTAAQPAEAAPTAVAATEEVIREEVGADDSPADPEPTAPAVEEAVSAGEITVVFDDGRSWTMPARDCSYDPDAGLSTLLMSGVGEDGVELNVVETWPLGGDRTGDLLWIASFVDDTDQVYTIHAPADGISTDDGISFTSGVFTNLFAAEGETPDAIATFRC